MSAFLKYLFVLKFILTLVVVSGQTLETPVQINTSKKNLHQILRELGKTYNIEFAYDSYALRKIEIQTKVESEETLDVLLKKILSPVNLSYREIDRTIVIFDQEPENTKSDNTAPIIRDITIKGEIKDAETGEPLPFATIVSNSNYNSVSSDVDGHFNLRLGQLPDTVQISYIGYESKIIRLDATNAENTLKVSLRPRRNFLPAVLIEAEGVRLLNTGPYAGLQTINPNDLSIAHGTGEADIFRTAQLLSGISGTQESSSGLFIRGSNSDQTLVSLDGFTVYHLDHFFGAFTAINTNAIKSMQIRKGPSEAKYGGRIAGMVELVGREGNFYSPSMQIDLGPLSAGFALETPLGENNTSSLMITGRKAFTDVLYSPTFKTLFNSAYNASVSTSINHSVETFGSEQDPKYTFQDLNLKYTYKPGARHLFSISGYHSKDALFVQYADTMQSEILNALDVKYTDESTWSNRGLGARWVYDLSPTWQSTLQAGVGRYITDYFSLDSIFDKLTNQRSIATSADKNNLTDQNLRWELQQRRNSDLLTFGTQLNRIETEAISNNQNSKEQAAVFSAYGQYEWKQDSLWAINSGIRVNYYSGTNKLYLELRLQGLYHLRKNIDLKWSAGRVHQFIHRIRSQTLYLNTPDIWQVSDGRQIPVLRSDQVAAGTVIRGKKWLLDSEVYYKRQRGQTTYLGVYATYNSLADNDDVRSNLALGHGYAYGLDLMLQRDFGKYHGWVAYSWMKAESRYQIEDNPLVPEPFEQRHEVKLFHEVEHKQWDFSLMTIYGSGRPYTPLLGNYNLTLPDGSTKSIPVFADLNSGRLPAYFRTDLGVSYKFNWGKVRGKIQASVFNLFNRKNIRDVQYLAIRDGSDNSYTIARRDVRMLNFLPSLNLQLKF